jgi:hypothetical protein
MTSVFANSVQDFTKRVEAVDKFYPSVGQHKESIVSGLLEIKNYQHKNLLDSDKLKINDLVVNLESLSDQMQSVDHYFFSNNIKKSIAEYQKNQVDRSIYTRYEAEVKNLENYGHHSKRLLKFIDHYKRGKYTSSKLDYALLNTQEKKIADDYAFKKSYVVREAGVQESLIREIALNEKKINEMLSFAEQAVVKVEQSHQSLVEIESRFLSLKEDVSRFQLNFAVDAWKMGHFSCDSKTEPAQYQRFKKFPNMIMLGNLGNQKAVVQFDAVSGEQKVIYACRKVGQFGGCLDNTERELCRLSEYCLNSLSQMEANYQRNPFFAEIGAELSQKILSEKEQDLRNRSRTNLIHEYAKLDKLIHFSEDQFYSVYSIVADKIADLKFSKPEDTIKDVKKIVDASSKKMLAELNQNVNGASSGKMNDTKNIINYVHQSVLSDMEKILKDDLIQEFAFSKCPLQVDAKNQFCEYYQSMTARAQAFKEVEPLENLNANKCPQVALRMSEKIEGCVSCKEKAKSSSVILDLHNSLQEIILDSRQ